MDKKDKFEAIMQIGEIDDIQRKLKSTQAMLDEAGLHRKAKTVGNIVSRMVEMRAATKRLG